MLVVPNEGEVKALQRILNEPLTMHLFSNDHTPAEGDTLASYTEVTGGGYASKSLAAGDWSYTSGSPSTAVQSQQEWTFTGAPTGSPNVYGYYILDADSVVRWAERFSESVVPYQPTLGARIRVRPRFQTS